MIDHEKYINRCFELAKNGIGKVSPNPLVGSVIVKNGEIISEGWHNKYGEKHAEADALAKTNENLSDAIIYCNLEPCCHTDKQTPPCTPKIINSGIKKVVISNLDPNPKVAGKGIQQLRENGIEVITNILEKEGEELNKFFFNYIKFGLPFLTIKVAESLDGKISAEKNKQTWLTGEESKIFVHQKRAEYDAILVGANTVKIDNPKLDVRLVSGRNPKKIIIDGNLSANINSNAFNSNSEETFIFIKKNSNQEKISQFLEKGINIVELESNKEGKIPIQDILNYLGKLKIISLFVEGGAEIFTQFMNSNLWNELVILQAPILLGNGVSSFNNVDYGKLNQISNEKLGDDLKLIFKNQNYNK